MSQSSVPPTQQLSGLDASFLYLETERSPMQIGGVSIVDAQTSEGTFGLDELRGLLASRLGVSRTLTQRLHETPLNLGKPYWVEDSEFDLDRHISRTQLPDPGGWKELGALMAWEFSRPLPRDRPLWEILLVEGLRLDGYPDGSIALISKIHHAAIDGVSGSEMMSALYDVKATSPPPYRMPNLETPAKPSASEMLKRSRQGLQKTPKALTQGIVGALGGLVKSGVALGRERIMPPPLPFTAPRTPFNVAVSQERSWGAALLPLDRIKTLRKHFTGTTINDVVLAICSGALRQYLVERQELPKKPLVAMVPISVRAEEESGTMGNKVSAMLVSLATDLEPPAERLAAVHDNASRSKLMHHAVGARNLADSSEFIPFSLAGLGTRLYTRLHLAEKHRPIFNLVITNVPGPQVPLYVGGARLLSHIGAAPVFDGMGLILPIFSYAGTLAIGVTACRKVMQDVDRFTELLHASLDELYDLIEA